MTQEIELEAMQRAKDAAFKEWLPRQNGNVGQESYEPWSDGFMTAWQARARVGKGEELGPLVGCGDGETRIAPCRPYQKPAKPVEVGATSDALITSPTYTREELVEICKTPDLDKAARMYKTGLGGINDVIRAVLDALIAIGAVRVK